MPHEPAVGGRHADRAALVAAGRQVDDCRRRRARALPLEDPPELCAVFHGFCTGPVTAVCEPPEKQRSSQTAFPAMVAPAASRRFTIVASSLGT